MRTAAPADGAGRTMRGAALLSVLAHVFALTLPAALWLLPAIGPHEVEAQVEVVFGNNADVAGTPAGAPALPVAATATVRTDVPPADSGVAPPPPPPAVEGPHPSGGKVGLLVEHPDPQMTEAQADPGNRAPKYPDVAWLAREQGEVVIRLHIDPDGRVTRAELRHSSGHAALDQAAAEALARWRFVPALRDGVAVPSYRDQATDFELEGLR